MHSLLIAGGASIGATAFVVGLGLFRLSAAAARLPRPGSQRHREAIFFATNAAAVVARSVRS